MHSDLEIWIREKKCFKCFDLKKKGFLVKNQEIATQDLKKRFFGSESCHEKLLLMLKIKQSWTFLKVTLKTGLLWPRHPQNWLIKTYQFFILLTDFNVLDPFAGMSEGGRQEGVGSYAPPPRFLPRPYCSPP